MEEIKIDHKQMKTYSYATKVVQPCNHALQLVISIVPWLSPSMLQVASKVASCEWQQGPMSSEPLFNKMQWTCGYYW